MLDDIIIFMWWSQFCYIFLSQCLNESLHQMLQYFFISFNCLLSTFDLMITVLGILSLYVDSNITNLQPNFFLKWLFCNINWTTWSNQKNCLKLYVIKPNQLLMGMFAFCNIWTCHWNLHEPYNYNVEIWHLCYISWQDVFSVPNDWPYAIGINVP